MDTKDDNPNKNRLGKLKNIKRCLDTSISASSKPIGSNNKDRAEGVLIDDINRTRLEESFELPNVQVDPNLDLSSHEHNPPDAARHTNTSKLPFMSHGINVSECLTNSFINPEDLIRNQALAALEPIKREIITKLYGIKAEKPTSNHIDIQDIELDVNQQQDSFDSPTLEELAEFISSNGDPRGVLKYGSKVENSRLVLDENDIEILHDQALRELARGTKFRSGRTN